MAVAEPYETPQPLRPVGRTRSPVGVWLLSIITLGIYYLVWYYKINNEMRRFDPSIRVSPGVAVLAVSVGALAVFVFPIVSTVMTGGRIAQAQRTAGAPVTTSGGVGCLLFILCGLNTIYYQAKLNEVWSQVRSRQY